MNYLDHSLNFFRRDWPGAALLSQQIHDMGGELITCLEQKRRAFGLSSLCQSSKIKIDSKFKIDVTRRNKNLTVRNVSDVICVYSSI